MQDIVNLPLCSGLSSYPTNYHIKLQRPLRVRSHRVKAGAKNDVANKWVELLWMKLFTSNIKEETTLLLQSRSLSVKHPY